MCAAPLQVAQFLAGLMQFANLPPTADRLRLLPFQTLIPAVAPLLLVAPDGATSSSPPPFLLISSSAPPPPPPHSAIQQQQGRYEAKG